MWYCSIMQYNLSLREFVKTLSRILFTSLFSIDLQITIILKKPILWFEYKNMFNENLGIFKLLKTRIHIA